MKKDYMMYIGVFVVIAAMCLITLSVVDGEFGGSDDSGGETTEDYGYTPWTVDLFCLITGNDEYELPGETESLLFAVQAAIGAIIIGYFIGLNAGKKKATTADCCCKDEECCCEESAPEAAEAPAAEEAEEPAEAAEAKE